MSGILKTGSPGSESSARLSRGDEGFVAGVEVSIEVFRMSCTDCSNEVRESGDRMIHYNAFFLR